MIETETKVLDGSVITDTDDGTAAPDSGLAKLTPTPLAKPQETELARQATPALSRTPPEKYRLNGLEKQYWEMHVEDWPWMQPSDGFTLRCLCQNEALLELQSRENAVAERTGDADYGQLLKGRQFELSLRKNIQSLAEKLGGTPKSPVSKAAKELFLGVRAANRENEEHPILAVFGAMRMPVRSKLPN